jgi:acetyl-CoA carboxylase biotin carboxyl carrier protein
MELTDEDIREILRIIDESDLDELRIEVSGLLLHVRKNSAGSAPVAPIAPSGRAPVASGPETPASADAAAPPITPGAPEDAVDPGDAIVIDAPMLGMFYRAEAPGEPAFVEVGDTVEPGTVICLIEVMKMMNHVTAGVSGTVVEVLAENGALVEFGQPLFQLAPNQ